MKFTAHISHKVLIAAVASSFALIGGSAWAQSAAVTVDFAELASKPLMPAGLYSSSILDSASDASKTAAPANGSAASVLAPAAKAASVSSGSWPGAIPAGSPGPFSAVAVTVKVGSTGIGVDLATPLAHHFGLRTGASYFAYNPTLTTDGMNINGELHLQNASTSLDIYPFHNTFRISPGVTWNNATRMSATLFAPGGSQFSFGNGPNTYSDPTNPVHGTANVVMGHGIAPRITMGWGNILPTHGRVSFPVEFGMQYTQKPTMKLVISGNGCGSQTEASGTVDTGCGPVDQSDVAQEQTEINNDIAPLRFFPIVSLGVSFRFGHPASRGE